MKINNMNISIDKALFIAGAVTTIRVNLSKSKEKLEKTMLFKKHQPIAKLFSDEFWGSQ
jgi:C4-type Zn-finger protein